MKAINLNSRPYYVTGKTLWDNGKEHHFDAFKSEPIVCPQVHRYGPEISPEEEAAQNPADKRKWSLRHPTGMKQPIGYTITYLTCEILTAEQQNIEDSRAEFHAAKQLENDDNQ